MKNLNFMMVAVRHMLIIAMLSMGCISKAEAEFVVELRITLAAQAAMGHIEQYVSNCARWRVGMPRNAIEQHETCEKDELAKAIVIDEKSSVISVVNNLIESGIVLNHSDERLYYGCSQNELEWSKKILTALVSLQIESSPITSSDNYRSLLSSVNGSFDSREVEKFHHAIRGVVAALKPIKEARLKAVERIRSDVRLMIQAEISQQNQREQAKINEEERMKNPAYRAAKEKTKLRQQQMDMCMAANQQILEGSVASAPQYYDAFMKTYQKNNMRCMYMYPPDLPHW